VRTGREWWVEIVIALLIALAVFLLVERMNIRQTLFVLLMRLVEGLAELGSRLSQGVANFVRHTTLSDLTAYVLLVAVIGLVLWRVRQRLLRQARLTEPNCPRCGGKLHRIHRRLRDRALNVYVPVRRYRCSQADCTWRGLRVRSSHHE
jgi:hypothetical protein